MKNGIMWTRLRNEFLRAAGNSIIAFLAWLIVSGCSVGKGSTEPMDILTANSWVLCEMKQKLVSNKDFENGSPVIKFEEGGRLQIFTGCNYINGTFAIYKSSLKMKFDADNSCKQFLVSDFLTILKSSTKYKTKSERLVLIRDANELMYFFPK